MSHSSVDASAILQCVEAFMHSDVSLVPLKELSLNDYVTKELEKVATELGYMVSINKSRLVSQMPTKLHASRFQSSKPDLFMFNPKLQKCYMVNEDNATGAGENKNDEKAEEPTSQLLGNMEKIGGDCLWHWLQFGQPGRKIIKKITIYGLTIDYKKSTTVGYKLTMDFEKKASRMEICDDVMPIEDGINRLVSSLQRSLDCQSDSLQTT